MKRDFDLIRSVLFHVEAAPSGQPVMQLSVEAPGEARESWRREAVLVQIVKGNSEFPEGLEGHL